MKIIAVPLIAVSLVASFAHADQQSTAKSRWEIIGATDATYGHQLRTESELSDFGKFIPLEFENYRKAYFRSLTKYCDPEAAFQQGQRGMEYAGQCSGLDNEEEIVSRWAEGLKKPKYIRLMYTSTD